MIVERVGLHIARPIRTESTPEEDLEMLLRIREQFESPPGYNALLSNCIWWAAEALCYGLDSESDCPDLLAGD
jgi:hypothetical protein